MQKNKKVYFLVAINLLVWGWFGFRIYTFLNKEEAALPNEMPLSIKKNKTKDSAAYVLMVNYPDPFLKTESEHKRNNNSSGISQKPPQNKTIVNQVVKAAETKTVDIKYMGLVQNKTSGTATALININGKSYIIKKGDIVDNIAFNNINKDNIEVKIGRDKMIITK